jgi:hypothetical protein
MGAAFVPFLLETRMELRRAAYGDLFPSTPCADPEVIQYALEMMVALGELRTFYDPATRKLVYFDPQTICLATPLEWN